ncbi:MAG: hypothetical protein ACJAZO_000216 [Myxococcota bacterium]
MATWFTLLLLARGCGVSDVTDPDGDGIVTADERDLGTDPNNADTDGDGLRDNGELAAGTNPLDEDSDNDGLSDGGEVRLGLDPLTADGPDDALSVFLNGESDWRTRGEAPFTGFTLSSTTLGFADFQPGSGAPTLECYGLGIDLICPDTLFGVDGSTWSLDGVLSEEAGDPRFVLTSTRTAGNGAVGVSEFDAVEL